MKPDQIRIIGGSFRGRKIHFPTTKTLRPTPDRIRETLFNWLAPYIVDSRCLDLFAGSGVLGFEAVSRGASQVVLLEQDPNVISSINVNADILKPKGLEIIQADCLKWLQNDRKKSVAGFDIVFVDPPYADKLLPLCFTLLQEYQWLNQNAHIYFESDQALSSIPLPDGWEMLREKKAGNVYYGLAKTITITN